MKNTSLVTISTIHRTFSFSLGPTTRMVLGCLLLLLVAVFVAGSFLVYQFNDHVRSLSARKNELNHKILDLNSSMQDLQNEINTQRYAFERLNELEALTEVPFLDASYAEGSNSATGASAGKHLDTALTEEEQQQLLERIDQVRLSLVERSWLLYSIPNGSPMPGKHTITSGFGKRIHPITGKRQYHYGIDMPARRGDPITNTANGVVKFAGNNKSGYGKIVIIAHNYGFITRYAHLDKILVKKGEFVSRGQVIGHAGKTGITTGVHLHYEIEYLDSKINPKPFITWGAENYNHIFTKEKSIQWSTLISLIRTQIKNQEQPQLLPTAATLKEN